MKPTRSLEERIEDANSLADYHLGNAHEAEEQGDLTKAAELHAKYNFWSDRLKVLSRQRNRIEPRRK